MRRLLSIGLGLILVGCQSTPSQPPRLSLDEAKKISTEFTSPIVALPPRRIDDITAILDEQKPDQSYRAAVKARLDELPPTSADATELADFYARRSNFALQAGMGTQAVADARESVRYAKGANYEVSMRSLSALKGALIFVGEPDLDVSREMYARSRNGAGMWSMSPLIDLTIDAIRNGKVDEAGRFVELSDQTLTRMTRAEPNPYGVRADNAQTHANYEEGIGHLVEAEYWAREAVDYGRKNLVMGADVRPESFSRPQSNRADWILGNQVLLLTRILVKEGKLTEAEVAARDSLLFNIRRSGRTSPQTAISIANLAYVVFHQGRYREAELLRNAQIQTRDALGIQTWDARNALADVLSMEGRWPDALRLYREAERDNPKAISRPYRPIPRFIAMYEGGEVDRGLALAKASASLTVGRMGDESFDSSLALGIVASGQSLKGQPGEALRSFRTAFPQLQSGAAAAVAAQIPLIQRYRSYVLEAYLWTLIGTRSEFKRTAAEVAEAFQVADTARVAGTDRAVSAAVARVRLPNADLADLARREQDARQQVTARQEMLASALSRPTEEQSATALATLRADTDKLKQAQAVLKQEIEKRFPGYANLVNPPPATVEEGRAALSSDEALVAIYAGEKESYVWALRKEGEVAFAVVPLGSAALAQKVTQLRQAVDPHARTLGEIPPFDVELGYELYAALLKPVEAGWKGAKRLVVVPSGPLAQVPFSLLVTKPLAQPTDGSGALFSGYRQVPFLARELGISQMPSVAALVSLRVSSKLNANRKPFVGYGDPWFSTQQAAQAEHDQVSIVDSRGVVLRAAPATAKLSSAKLDALPRLPDTAQEVTEIAQALHADPKTDVYLGPAANEQQVRTMKLDDRRVVMFATHGLVPGDLDGLDQPALALSAPDVAKVPGDGLLTMDKILGLKLDADWVVLSACNTAAGSGAGAEAVSGLGRAFFYAGARALLVTNWPVETTSAKKLTTTLFQRQAQDQGLSRAEALRQSMLSLIDGPGYFDAASGRIVYSYAHPIFWAPYSLVGDGR